jgi:putative aldouronate transport system permease protein
MIRDKTLLSVSFDILNYLFLTILALACLLPLVNVFAISLSDRSSVTAGLVRFWPLNMHFENYTNLFSNGQVVGALFNSLQRVVLGSLVQVFVVILMAYPLSIAKPFPGQGIFKGLLIVGMLFYGGLIPWFLVIRALHLTNNIGGLILPMAVNIWSVILLVNFFRETPIELVEAAEIDGASHWTILFQIFVPLAIPAIALVTLYAIIGHWNAWFDGIVLMNDRADYPLQSLLQTMLTRQNTIWSPADKVFYISERGTRAALIMVAFIPVAIIYPFLSRYFVTGLKLGGIKG